MSSQTGYWSFDVVKAEKASALLRFNRLKNLTNFRRLVELCVVLVLLVWTVTRLPFAVRISGELLSRTMRVMTSPLFVFAICNVIIATLIGRFSGENHRGAISAVDDNAAETEHEKQLVKNNDRINNNISEQNDDNNIRWWPVTTLLLDNPLSIESTTTEDQVVFQDKQIIVVTGLNSVTDLKCKREESESGVAVLEEDPEVFRRTNSEKLDKKGVNKARVLRRSETDKYCKNSCPEDELSAEEFQRAVDEFIAKHSLFRRQEFFCSS